MATSDPRKVLYTLYLLRKLRIIEAEDIDEDGEDSMNIGGAQQLALVVGEKRSRWSSQSSEHFIALRCSCPVYGHVGALSTPVLA